MLTCGMYGKGNVGTESGCTDTEYAAEFALWCLCGVPLMLGCDLRSMSEATKKLVLNPELIKINQDPECRPPQCLPWGSDMQRFVLFKHLSDGGYAIGFFNMCDRDAGVPVYLEQLGIPLHSGYGLKLKDLFTGEELPARQEILMPKVPAHGCSVYRAEMVKVK